MGMYAALGISASGLAAERLRMDVIANNLANADSTDGVGDAYHRKAVVMAESSGSGAQFSLPRPAGLGSTGDDTADLHGVAVTDTDGFHSALARATECSAISRRDAKARRSGRFGRAASSTSRDSGTGTSSSVPRSSSGCVCGRASTVRSA